MSAVLAPHWCLDELLLSEQFLLPPNLTIKRYLLGLQQHQHLRPVPDKVVFLNELTKMRITGKFILIGQSEHLVPEIVHHIITLGVQVVPDQ